jgi:glycosyltransferase involved in cell wall biosynthesis
LEAVDAGVCPTLWQKSTHPKEYQHKLHLAHEGIRTDIAQPNLSANFKLANGKVLTAEDEVITYVARNLEPYRGFHILMRAVALICQRRPNAQILIIGGDEISYGRKLSKGETWREKMLKEVTVDKKRVHFLGKIPYVNYIEALQISSAHIYLTVPFVLSWSMLEAMSVGCVVIASNTAPVTEVIQNGSNGLLVDFFSPTEIADMIDEVLNKPTQYQKMRQAARKTIIDHYTIEQGIKQYTNLFESVLKSH